MASRRRLLVLAHVAGFLNAAALGGSLEAFASDPPRARPSPGDVPVAFDDARAWAFEARGTRLGVPIPVTPDVPVFAPAEEDITAAPAGASATNASATNERSPPSSPPAPPGPRLRPLLVYLHGFCLPEANQETYAFTAVRANANGGAKPLRQTLTQVGLREAADATGFVLATPTAPRATRACALCSLGESSPNAADRFTVRWINQTLARSAPAFQCPAWDGSDACCNPELGGEGDDVRFVVDVTRALVADASLRVDPRRVYLLGVATGGFMANRVACERPDVFAGVATIAGGVWSDASRCRPNESLFPNGASAFAAAATNVLHAHGDADLTVPLAGGENFAGVAFPSAERSFATLADAFGCDAEVEEDAFELVGGAGGNRSVDVAAETRRGCGGGAEVERWTLGGVDHFMEERVSRALFASVARWLASKTKA